MAVFLLQFIYITSLITTRAEIIREKHSGHRVLPQQQHDDLSQCLNDFQVSESTIIRTDDSRSMGAKYLNETEMPTKEACMKWCCDTDRCNVAVYEEKNKGSCYTFDCSPTGDFKCRFTTHEHYTSAVLKGHRHEYNSDEWANKNKHAEELSRLKNKETNPKIKSTTTTIVSTTTSPTTMVIEEISIGAVKIAPTSFVSSFPVGEKAPDERRCSRFQFECRNTSECIAIYNACDGIPQCSDASDESIELGCPVDSPRKTLGEQLNEYQLKNAHADDQTRDQIITDQQREVQANTNYNEYMAAQLQNQRQDQFQPQHFNGKNNNFRSTAFTHKNNGLLNNNYEAQLNNNRQRPIQQNHRAYMKSYTDGKAGDLPHIPRKTYSNQMPIDRGSVNTYFDQDYDTWPQNKNNFNAYDRPEISGNHQESHTAQTYSNGPYDSSGRSAQMNQYYKGKGYSNRDDYQEMPETKQILKNVKDDHFEGFAKNKELWPDDHQKQNEEQQFKEHIFTTDMQMTPLDIKNVKTKTDNGPNLKENSKQIPESTAAPTWEPETTTIEITREKQTNNHENIPHSQPNKVQVNLAEVEIQNMDHESGTNGAAVALTFGLTLTGMLIILVGCRLRVVRRHLLRGRSPFMHDSDYLVNGMYL